MCCCCESILFTIQIIHDRESRDVSPDSALNLIQNLFIQGAVKGLPLCAGLGTCGRCALLFHANPPRPSQKDIDYFSSLELEKGYRLGCAHYPAPGQSLELAGARMGSSFSWASSKPAFCLGIDIGTTSIKWAFEHQDGQMSLGETLNPQMGAGPDIMSRLSFALEHQKNFKYLTALVLDEVRAILTLDRVPENSVCLTGNPAMLYFLLGLDVSGLSFAPYRLDYRGGMLEKIQPGNAAVFIPALCSPFLGADISAGLTWVQKTLKPEYPFLLADLGTNGELVLALSSEKYLATSVALGPALEGIGLRWGSPYGKGIASRFVYTPDGLHPDGDWPQGRVSGCGYISLLALLLRLKMMSASGQLMKQDSNPAARKVMNSIRDGRLYLGSHFFLDGKDIEEVLKVKAAFTLGLSFLCAKGGISLDKLKTIYIAGAMGKHARARDLETLGFFPPGSYLKMRVLGNTSLLGALLLARNMKCRDMNLSQAGLVQTLNLGTRQDYLAQEFGRHMIFQYPG